MSARLGLALLLALGPGLAAAPVWKAPEQLPFGQLSQLELREDDPAAPALPRPGEERLGSLALRGVDPLPDGRGWRLTVQPLATGTARIPPMDLGDGRLSPELRLKVPRTVPFAAPWMGFGGGIGDAIPDMPFPWAWASPLFLPILALGWWLRRRWVAAGPARALRHARRAFLRHWPPVSKDRRELDAAHAAGRDLLAARFGDIARAWGAPDFRGRHLDAWATWSESLDAARFGRQDPPFPPREALLKALERP